MKDEPNTPMPSIQPKMRERSSYWPVMVPAQAEWPSTINE